MKYCLFYSYGKLILKRPSNPCEVPKFHKCTLNVSCYLLNMHIIHQIYYPPFMLYRIDGTKENISLKRFNCQIQN